MSHVLPYWLHQVVWTPTPFVPAIISAAAAYLSLVHLLRFQRVRVLQIKYSDALCSKDLQGVKYNLHPVAIGRPDVVLTPEEAQEIVRTISQLEMPGLMRFALTKALFNTYAIPTISEILVKTNQLSRPENVAKRFTDTGVLISTWTSCPFIDFGRMSLDVKDVDPRNAIAIARMNWLHSRWPTIRNDDLLYTLSLFTLEPIRWAKKYGWRELLPIEEQAYFVMWKEIGNRMSIRDIPETLGELVEWSESYAETAMVPASSNYEVCDHTLSYIMENFTERFGIRSVMRKISICLLEDRVRTAFMLPEPSPFMNGVMLCLMRFFAIRHRYFSLPRYNRYEYTPCKVPEEELKKTVPRLHPTNFNKVPWYKPEPKGLRWVAQRVLLKLGVIEEELQPGPKFKSEGYRLEECGPIDIEKEGHVEVMKMAAEIQGCPVTGPWAR